MRDKYLQDRNRGFWGGLKRRFRAFCETNLGGFDFADFGFAPRGGGWEKLEADEVFRRGGGLNTIDGIAKQRQFGGLIFAQQACPNFRWNGDAGAEPRSLQSVFVSVSL